MKFGKILLCGLLTMAVCAASLPLSGFGAVAQEGAAEEPVWDDVVTFDTAEETEEKFSAYFVSEQNNRRADRLDCSWKVEDGVLTRTNNVNPALTTSNVAILTYMEETYENFELSVDFRAGGKTGFWPVIGIRQQIPGKYYALPGGGAGVFMSQEGKITLWGPIIVGNVMTNLYEETAAALAPYYGKMWHTMVIRAEGTTLSVAVDGVGVYSGSVATTDYVKGYISLQSINNDCSFDNFKIRSLDGNSGSENEENRYPGDVPPQEPGKPSMADASVEYDVSSATDLTVPVDLNGNLITDLRIDGKSVNFNHYYSDYRSLTLRNAYLSSLALGEHTAELVTEGGTLSFTLSVAYENLMYFDEARTKLFGGDDVVIGMSPGRQGIRSVTVNGESVPEGAYSFEPTRFVLSKTYLAGLADGAYFWRVEDNSGVVEEFCVAKGITEAEIFAVDFDTRLPGAAWFIGNTAANGKWETVEDGIDNRSGNITVSSSVTLLEFGSAGYNAYPFRTGKYAFSMQFRINDISGVSTVLDLFMPMWLYGSSGNADVFYLSYTQEKGTYISYGAENTELTYDAESGVYTLRTVFDYDTAVHRGLSLPVWMSSDFVIDNVRLYPIAK